MQGGPGKNSQMEEKFLAAKSTHEKAIKLLKTTKIMSAEHLEEYLNQLSNPNCRVVVQKVEQGSSMELELERRFEQMQHSKGNQYRSTEQIGSGVQKNDHGYVLPKQTVVPRAETIKNSDSTPFAGHNHHVAQSTPAMTLNPHEEEEQPVNRPPKRADFNLKEGVSSLLMQMKNISIVPAATNNNDKECSTSERPTVDTYFLPNNSSSIKEKEEVNANASIILTEAPTSPIDQTEVDKQMKSLEQSGINTINANRLTNTVPEYQYEQHPIVISPDMTENNMYQVPGFDGKGVEKPIKTWVRGYSDLTELPPESFSNTPTMEPQMKVVDSSGVDLGISNMNETKLVKRFTPTARPQHQNMEEPIPTGMKNHVPAPAHGTFQQMNHGENTATNKIKTREPRIIPQNQVRPRRKAVVVGCSYLGDTEAFLRGTCNDAILFATILVTHMGFDVNDVLLLIDTEPADIYVQQLSILSSSQCLMNDGLRTSVERKKTGIIGGFLGGFVDDVFSGVKADQQLDIPELLMLDSPGQPIQDCNKPTRANILKALRWLTSNTAPGDSGVFYFSGHSLQTDDMSGCEGEGYDEALVPCDYMESGDPSRGIIPAQQIKQLIQSVDKCCQMTLIMDTVGMQTALDPAGRVGPWKFIKGAMLRGVWPLANATGKINCAAYDQDVWRDLRMQQQLVHPKFMPMLQLDCAASMVDGFISSNNINGSSNSICIAAAPYPEVAIEALFKPMDLTEGLLSGGAYNECKQVVCHGIFTYCLVATLLNDRSSKRGGITISELVTGIHKRSKYLKATRLPKLEQLCEVTLHPSGLANMNNFFLSPWGGRVLLDKKRMSNLRYPYKALSDGLNSFLSLPEAWTQLHNEGRVKAVEQMAKFGRMRSAVLNVSRMVTADVRNMMLMNQKGYQSSAPSSNVMLGHIPMQQHVIAGNSWYGHTPSPQHSAPQPAEHMMANHPMMYQQMVPPTPVYPGHQLMPQDYVIDQVIPSPQHMLQQHQPYVMNYQNMFYNPQQFGGYAQQRQESNFHRSQTQQKEMCWENYNNPARSQTSSVLRQNCSMKPVAPRNCTSSLKCPGYKLAEPLTSALVSQLPVARSYY